MRLNINIDIHGYKQVSNTDYFHYDCSECGDCCRNVKDSIMVESLDLYRLARFLKIEISEVITQYTNTAFLAARFPVFMLKTKQHMDACIFLRASRCSVHEAKPRACRTYPLGVGPNDDNPESWLSFIVSKKLHHFTGQRRCVGDWIGENLTAEDRTFVAADYNYTGELAKLMKNIDSRHDDQVMELVLFYKYVAYDMTEDFQPQYTRNMTQLKKQLERLGC
jgi:Fe-S-cluster containining protein